MRLDTAASLSTRHRDLLAEADAARLAGNPSLGIGRLFRRAGEQMAGVVSDLRSVRAAAPAATTTAKSAARS